ncbi:hypothetical protein OG453_38150 [Streptomyces sp. NBC_01381]|uniref:hypothetical protein n=1 Tax=Streptomyces sp. NBC_01381 TaxID=2903845 RepID=UPI00224F28C6|nr:hypothetical protein [Streptomyces sp. NBC_01381]MCX4672414.1 hypothetical protein [Streptomyces sp. NBC_01381]
MITPSMVHVSANGRTGTPDELWLHFDMTLLVELPPDLARCLTYQLADKVGLLVSQPLDAGEAAP